LPKGELAEFETSKTLVVYGRGFFVPGCDKRNVYDCMRGSWLFLKTEQAGGNIFGLPKNFGF